MAQVVRNFGLETLRSLAEAIGLDPDAQHIQKIVIEADIREVTVAVVQVIVDTEQHNRVTTLLKRFTLVPKELPVPDGK